MPDFSAFLIWLTTIELLGLAVLPLTFSLFRSFPDRGYGFSKILGILLTSWVIWILGSFKFLPFTRFNSILIAGLIFLLNWGGFLWENRRRKTEGEKPQFKTQKFLSSVPSLLKSVFYSRSSVIKLIVIEEFLFVAALGFWSYVRGFSPDIHGLEKFMDYGFMLSALRGQYFPPLDHFFAGGTINYYYFGHLMAAILTKLSDLAPNLTYNLQIANLFALTVGASFTIGAALISALHKSETNPNDQNPKTQKILEHSDLNNSNLFRASNFEFRASGNSVRVLAVGGLLTAFLVALAGNLHTLVYYPAQGDRYWYPDATRFIEYTIDEFPVYSWIVADLHGHVSAIPLALLVIALLFAIFVESFQASSFKFQVTILAIAIGVNYATNAWNFPIYLAFGALIFWYLNGQKFKSFTNFSTLLETAKKSLLLFLLAVLAALPFFLQVKPLTGGLGLVGAYLNSRFPKPNPILAILNLFVIHSPFWKILVLWGFYLFLAFAFILWLFRTQIHTTFKLQNLGKSLLGLIASVFGIPIEIKSEFQNPTFDQSQVAPSFDRGAKSETNLNDQNSKNQELKTSLQPPSSAFRLLPSDAFALISFLSAILLILLPEWIYIKDIYLPDYFRANTMFKFYFQAWLFMAAASAYSVLRLFSYLRSNPSWFGFFYRTLFLFLLGAVALYPYLAVRSVTDRFRNHKGLDGTQFMKTLYPTDWQAIQWLNENIQGQPILLEAVGESYTDYSRVSGLTGIPAVLGWPVHEWLWRGSFGEQVNPKANFLKIQGVDSVASRTSDVQQIYEAESVETAQKLLQKYQVSYVFVGQLEHEKYPNLKEEELARLGKVVFENEGTKVYQVKQ